MTGRPPMDCANARRHLVDEQRGRLRPGLDDSLAAHLASCPACAQEDQAERLLTEQLVRHLPQHAAPLALKRRLAAEWPPAAVLTRPPAAGWTRRAAIIAALALAALAGAVATAMWLGRSAAADRLVAEAVTDHLRVLARNGTYDVQSGDMHQVRPWLTSRLDFAPAIPFAGDSDFPLRGGALDYFLDRRAAIAIYGRRLHTVTLIVARPDDLPWPARPLATSARGFNVRLWRSGGLGYALVSDVDAAELARLAAHLGGA